MGWMQLRPEGQSDITVQERNTQMARASPMGARAWVTVGLSGHAAVTAVLMRLPQMPWVGPVPALKHTPRHWVFTGLPMASGTVMVGSHGDPSGRRERTAGALPHDPVRVLQRGKPAPQSASVWQWGKQPV